MNSNRLALSSVLNSIDNYRANALPVKEAQAIIQSFVQAINEIEKLDLHSGLGRVLAVDIISNIDVPAHDNSAMDGYAFNHQTALKEIASSNSPLNLEVTGSSLAGHPFQGVVLAGQCVRIMTGAVMPKDCDTVIPQELCAQIDDNNISFDLKKIALGDNRRFKGEDLAKDSIALHHGTIISPADLGLIASLGIGEVFVKRRIKVAIFSTGDELRSVGESLDQACVYDSNRYTLYGMLRRLDCEIFDMGVIPDNPQALEMALRDACLSVDAIITSGGVSVGAADYTKQVMAQLGEVEFWTIGMRPGRPMAFGKIESKGNSAYLFGLPGNPVAVMVSFYFFVRNALLHLMGAEKQALITTVAISKNAIKKRPGRTEYQRGKATQNSFGEIEVAVTGSQGSGVLRSMSEANCMIILGDELCDISAGESVEILLFHGLI
jgi:molybdopterin molybdotransferase